MKKIFSLMMMFSLVLLFGQSISVHAAGENLDVVAPMRSEKESVNTVIEDTISQGGCWTTIAFRVKGTYTYSGNHLMNNDIAVSIETAPSDWTVKIDNVTYTMNDGNLKVTISYHYKASYYDCAYTGGYVYTAVEGNV